MKIGTKLKDLRVAKNLTQEELADRAELSKGFISQIERDLTSPSIATLVDILQCLGTDLQEFFSTPADEQIVFHDQDFFRHLSFPIQSNLGKIQYTLLLYTILS